MSEFISKPLAERVVGIDDNWGVRFKVSGKEQFFCLIVVFHCAVDVQMILRQVREHGGSEMCRSDALLIKPEGGYLHDGILTAGIRHAAQQAFTALESRRQEAVPQGEDIRVKVGYQTVHVPLSAIQYIEGRNNYACFHLDFREDVVPQLTLREVEALLPEGKFVRIHRSFIVPLWRIESSTAVSVKLMGLEDPLPVGRAYKERLKNER